MSEIQINDLSVIFTDDCGKETEIINCTNLLKNKSRIPFHAIEAGQLTITGLINNTSENTLKVFNGISNYDIVRMALFNSLFISQLVKASKPFRIAEIGSTDGLVSYQLTQIAGTVSPQSQVYYISNVIGNDSNNYCLNAVSAASCYPKMSFIYSDYEDICISDGHCDITVINGSALFNNHYDVVAEARRITRKNGIIICINAKDLMLENTFKMVFSERETYTLCPSDSIMTAVNNDSAWSAYDPVDISAEYEALLKKYDEVSSTSDKALLRRLIADVDSLADEAVIQHETELKIKLISLKEQLINQVCRI